MVCNAANLDKVLRHLLAGSATLPKFCDTCCEGLRHMLARSATPTVKVSDTVNLDWWSATHRTPLPSKAGGVANIHLGDKGDNNFSLAFFLRNLRLADGGRLVELLVTTLQASSTSFRTSIGTF